MIRTRKVFPILLVICCLAFTGCGNATATTKDTTSQTETDSTTTAQAYETNQEPSAEENEQEEKERREEIAEQYSIYSEFGLNYDTQKDRFFFDGNIVRYFKDTVNEEHTNSFFYEDGTIDLNAIRDTSGNLTGLEVASKEEFEARTAKYNEDVIAIQSAGAGDSGSFEGGNPDMPDDSLEAYSEIGVSYDTTTNKWIYKGQQIYFFYDPDIATYIDYSAADGVSIKVVRDENKNIKEVVEMTSDEVAEIIQ